MAKLKLGTDHAWYLSQGVSPEEGIPKEEEFELDEPISTFWNHFFGEHTIGHSILGTRNLPSIDLTPMVQYINSSITWREDTPEDTNISVEVAVDDSEFEEVQNGESIPQLEEGEYLTGKRLYIRQTLTTDDARVTPSIDYFNVMINDERIQKESIVDFYVTHTDNPSPDDWVPLLPRNKKNVGLEKLHFQRNYMAELRFQADPNRLIMLYRNYDRLPEDYWELQVDNKTIVIEESVYNEEDTYSIMYYPDTTESDPRHINFEEMDISTTTVEETFEGGTNRNGVIHLTNYPYVNVERLMEDDDYQPIRVTLYNADIAGPSNVVYDRIEPEGGDTEAFTKNKTEYLSQREPNIKNYSIDIGEDGEPEYLGFDYIHDGRKLKFNETFNKSEHIENQAINHGNADIKVEYEQIAPSIRVKAILRNLTDNEHVTPVLDKYRVYLHYVR